MCVETYACLEPWKNASRKDCLLEWPVAFWITMAKGQQQCFCMLSTFLILLPKKIKNKTDFPIFFTILTFKRITPLEMYIHIGTMKKSQKDNSCLSFQLHDVDEKQTQRYWRVTVLDDFSQAGFKSLQVDFNTVMQWMETNGFPVRQGKK